MDRADVQGSQRVERLSGSSTSGCPEWHYDAHRDRAAKLPAAEALVISRLRRGEYDGTRIGPDSRPVHRDLFAQLVDPMFAYFAGNYRGTPGYHCLERYEIGVQQDRRVGYRADGVLGAMALLGKHMQESIGFLDTLCALSNADFPREDKLNSIIIVAARYFQEFLTVHPYADGNGHIGRFLVWLLIGRYGLWPEKWTIEPRPALAPGAYGAAISAHRDGRPEDLEAMIRSSLR